MTRQYRMWVFPFMPSEVQDTPGKPCKANGVSIYKEDGKRIVHVPEGQDGEGRWELCAIKYEEGVGCEWHCKRAYEPDESCDENYMLEIST